jgi:hypothetical protein
VASPWVLVASNVGAEGIDLHTYTRRIVITILNGIQPGWNSARGDATVSGGCSRSLFPFSTVSCLARMMNECFTNWLRATDGTGCCLARQRRSSRQTKEAKKCGLNPPERASVTFPGSLAANPMNGLQS